MSEKYIQRVESKLTEFLWLIKQKQISIEKISDEMLMMSKDNKMIMRWDTAPHHPKIPTHPYHVHDGPVVKSSPKMNIVKVIDEVSKIVIGNLMKET